MNRVIGLSIPSLSILMAAAVSIAAIQPVEASLADRVGIWSTEMLEPTMVIANGTKAGFDPGSAWAAALGHLDQDGVVDLVVVHSGNGGAFAVSDLNRRDDQVTKSPRGGLGLEVRALPRPGRAAGKGPEDRVDDRVVEDEGDSFVDAYSNPTSVLCRKVPRLIQRSESSPATVPW